ncbi:integrase [Streptococcus cuniculi]|uniref:Integrase n=1 Tax=Streptococcus cuniculi TaxID=1432788 RepID=A0A1Q8E648_9STRE|nr:recombinase family protein [Streptococcus cuniculi]OLF47272.1 integrase [Streptococcus cuniculi]QBX23130.1 integrase [Streptococcus phage Javan116]
MIATNKVAIYVRVSTISQAEEGYSIDEQINKLKAYCDIKDWSIYDVYSDGGFSGASTNRPALERLINDAMKKEFDTVIVYKLDRLSRSQKDTLYLIEEIFNKYDIAFYSLAENFDTSTAFGKAMVGILSVFAQLEREQIKERMLLGKLGRAKAGHSMMWTNPPFGYRISKGDKVVSINPVQSVIVKRIFSEYIAGKPISKILTDLDTEGHVGRSKPWSLTTIKDILKNPTYWGKIRYQGELYDGLHEPIISEEEFKLAQVELRRRQDETFSRTNNPRPFQSKYMLSGLLKCGYCGSTLRIYVAHKRKDGTYPPLKYQCANRFSKDTKKRCNSRQYDKSELEATIISKLNQLRLNNDIEVVTKPNINKDELKQEIQAIATKLNRLTDLYVDGIINRDDLQKRRLALENQKSILESELAIDHDELLTRRKQTILEELGRLNLIEGSYVEQTTIVRKVVKEILVKTGSIDLMLDI